MMNPFLDFEDIYDLKNDMEFFSMSKPKIFEIKKAKIQKKWVKDEDKLLIELAKKFNGKSWKKIASHFTDKTPLQCFSRYKRIRPGIVKGSWTKEEDRKILDLVAKYGRSWSKISRNLITRNGKQIRDRYINILDPNVKKGKFCLEEDLKLLNLYRQFGSKWATISKFFENRTADMIKNRFHSSIKKNIKFLEDIENEYNKDCILYNTEQQTRFGTPEEFSNCKINFKRIILVNNLIINQNDSSATMTEETKRKDFEFLQTVNTINLNYVQKPICESPSWQLEDYFIF